MDILVPRPATEIWFVLGLPALAVLVALLLRGRPLRARLILVAAVSAICAGVFRYASRPMRFSWDAGGVTDRSFGFERRIAWNEVRHARVVKAFRHTALRPVRRTRGVWDSGWSSGTWELADGRSARVFLAPRAQDALEVTTADTTYLWAPPSFDRLLDNARARVDVAP